MPDQRLYNVNILVACDGPDAGDTLETRYGPMKSRGLSKLKNTRSDVELMDRYWSGSDGNVCNLILENPSVDEFREVIEQAHFLLGKYPAGKSGIDFYFSGHGLRDGGLVLRDGQIYADDFLELLSNYTLSDEGRLGFGYILDCCFSGAFLFKTLEVMERDNHLMREKLRMYDALASSMYDEVSRESNKLGYGIFTLAFAIKADSGVDVERLKEIIEIVPNRCPEMKKLLINDISAMEFTPFTPAVNRLTTYLTMGTQNPIDCINGHALVTESRGEFHFTELDDAIDVVTLMNAFPARPC